MTDLVWSSALGARAPSVPRGRDWSAGVIVAIAGCAAAASWYATLDHSIIPLDQEEEERVVVALGGSAAKRIEAPPPSPQNAPVVDKPPAMAERARDAAPIAPPPEPRPAFIWTQGNGEFSSGTGGTAQTPSPPPPLPPPPPPPPRKEAAGVGSYFTQISTERYSRLIVYPKVSLQMQEEGVGVLSVVITPQGKVLSWSLAKSTGKKRLDAEIVRVAGLVSNLDALPPDFPAKRAVVQITITFKLMEAPE